MEERKVQIYGIQEESIVDGPGIRVVYFLQGCKHNCKGCHNPETHKFTTEQGMTLDSLYEIYKQSLLAEGVTFSGGDPMEQAEDLLPLIKRFYNEGIHIMMYTGYTWEYLKAYGNIYQREVLKYINILVDGPFVLEKRMLSLKYRGSANQRIIDVQKTLSDGKIVLADV